MNPITVTQESESATRSLLPSPALLDATHRSRWESIAPPYVFRSS